MGRTFKLPPRKPEAEAAATQKAVLSRRSKTSRARGRGFEKSTAEDIREALGAHPEDVKRTPAAVKGKDIILHHSLRPRFPFHVECKNTKTLAVPAWIEQAEQSAKEDGLGLEPCVVFKLPKNSKKYIILSFDYFLEKVLHETNVD